MNKKIEDKDLTVLTNIQRTYNELLIEAGRLYLTQNELDRARSDFEKRYDKFQLDEKEIINKFTDKYGEGTVDFEKKELILS
jgi:hypothetical protein